MRAAAQEKPSALSRIYNPLDSLFRNNFWDTMTPEFTSTTPSVNIKENKNEYLIEMAIPGMKKEDINIDVEDSIMTIWSEKESQTEENKDEYSRREYNYSSFSRSFTIPQNAKTDKVSARYADGMLKLSIPKDTEAQKNSGKKIKVE